jgi:hypothetical protein
MRSLPRSHSAGGVSAHSYTLRTGLRWVVKNRFLMSWWVSVEEPRIGVPAACAASLARRNFLPVEAPWRKKRASSAATTARSRCDEISSIAIALVDPQRLIARPDTIARPVRCDLHGRGRGRHGSANKLVPATHSR